MDRIELMIRDADAEWPGGFTVFRLIPLSAATACMLSTAPYGLVARRGLVPPPLGV